jgi:hypothetical protein
MKSRWSRDKSDRNTKSGFPIVKCALCIETKGNKKDPYRKATSRFESSNLRPA